MLINAIGDKESKKIIMLPGSFCNSKSMENLYNILKDDLLYNSSRIYRSL